MEVKLPDYVFLTSMEQNFNMTETLERHQERGFVPYVAIVLYLACAFVGQTVMLWRPAFQLDRSLIVWNALMSIFNICGSARMSQEMLHTLTVSGFRASVCDANFREPNNVFGLWGWLFCLSKFWELGDTAFLVLRKKPLIFLHVYHHAIVIPSSWLTFGDEVAQYRYFSTVNYSIHAVMYSYYTVTAMRVRVSDTIRMIITFSQIVQMATGLFVSFAALIYLHQDAGCRTTVSRCLEAVFFYVAFTGLFSNFFYQAYVKPALARQKRHSDRDLTAVESRKEK